MTPQATPPDAKRGRGRSPIEYDNSRVRDFLSDYPKLSDLIEICPTLDDVLTAACAAKTTGDTAMRPLSKLTVFAVVSSCDCISTSATEDTLRWRNYSQASLKRYTQAARTASLFIGRELAKLD